MNIYVINTKILVQSQGQITLEQTYPTKQKCIQMVNKLVEQSILAGAEFTVTYKNI